MSRVEPESFDLQPILTGVLVQLRPMREEDFDDLYAVASDPLIWEQHPQRDRWQKDVFRAFFDKGMASGGALVVIDRADGRIIGSSRFHPHEEEDGAIEIGWTFLARSHWGGRFNGEVKRLMLRHAFQFVPRVFFLVATANRRSQRAMERIGAFRSGTRCDDAGLDHFVYDIEAPLPPA